MPGTFQVNRPNGKRCSICGQLIPFGMTAEWGDATGQVVHEGRRCPAPPAPQIAPEGPRSPADASGAPKRSQIAYCHSKAVYSELDGWTLEVEVVRPYETPSDLSATQGDLGWSAGMVDKWIKAKLAQAGGA